MATYLFQFCEKELWMTKASSFDKLTTIDQEKYRLFIIACITLHECYCSIPREILKTEAMQAFKLWGLSELNELFLLFPNLKCFILANSFIIFPYDTHHREIHILLFILFCSTNKNLNNMILFRSDRGSENSLIIQFMRTQRGFGRSSAIVGKSVHNQVSMDEGV